MGEQNSIIDYIILDEKLRKDVLDVKAVRGLHEGSNYCVVLTKIKIKGRLEYGRKNAKGKVSKMLPSEMMA